MIGSTCEECVSDVVFVLGGPKRDCLVKGCGVVGGVKSAGGGRYVVE